MKKILLIASLFIFLISCGDKEKSADVMIKTKFGDIKIKLYDETPLHKANFLKLAADGYLNNTLFHRCIPGFMVQGGDPTSKNATAEQRLGNGGPNYLIDAEIGKPHYKGALCAARTGGPNNPDKKSSGSQFYIVEGRLFKDAELDRFEKMHKKEFTEEERNIYKTKGGSAMLDTDYTVFGMVVEGFDIVEKINAQATGASNRPVEDISMEVIKL